MINVNKDTKYLYGVTKDGRQIIKVTDGKDEAVVELLNSGDFNEELEKFQRELELLNNIRYVPQDLDQVARILEHVVELNYRAFKLYANYMLVVQSQKNPEQKKVALEVANSFLKVADSKTRQWASMSSLWMTGEYNGMRYSGANPYNYKPSVFEVPSNLERIAKGEQVVDKYGNPSYTNAVDVCVRNILFGANSISIGTLDNVGHALDYSRKPKLEDIKVAIDLSKEEETM